MNYRHEYHAGNFADVVKHVALVAVLLHLRKKEQPFAVIDTHAGGGLYELSGEKAQRTREAAGGIERIADLARGPAALRTYLEIVREYAPDRYPGSPLIAAKLLRAQDRLVAIEKHPEEQSALAHTLGPFKRARAVLADGYDRLPALLPPPERRGIVLVDPPYEADGEFAELARAGEALMRRFATGIALFWFPLKAPSAADAFCGELLGQGVKKLVRVDIAVGGPAKSEQLAAAGLAVVNPPFGFDTEMRETMEALRPRLGADPGRPADFRVEWLAGGS